MKYRFGRFTLDDGAGLLKSDEREVPLRPKSFEVLRYLVEHPQQVISRTKLLRAVWPDVVVSEDSVTQCLVEIRRALDDHDHTLVRTLPKRGYMLDLPVITQPTTHGTFRAWRGAGRKRLLSRRPPSRWTVVALIFLALCIAATWWRAGIQG